MVRVVAERAVTEVVAKVVVPVFVRLFEMERLVEVLLVVVPFAELIAETFEKFVIPVTVSGPVIVVVASDEVPETVRVPEDEREDVAVIEPPVREYEVRFAMRPVVALKMEAKRLVLVALVVVLFVAVKLVAERLVKIAERAWRTSA
jgi:predicted tellurium resistance membrane protein TerC